METNRRRDSARCDIVRSAEGGQEIVEGVFVGQIHYRQTRAPFIPVAVENVVMADRDIEEIAGRDAGRIVVVILGAGCWNLDQS